ncbi:hypothetical protein KAM429_20600 [Aquipseudomonas alcaligenes]|uniref:Uncharacterized protein n=1 Tax=Aquipseudomonas alcaligenes TaxID=43263 RepID=A0AA37FMP0_AQUAC|nr:hypothetical protein KAM426_18150 [Pseudomonas alcaligenes]GIZ66695.1 hypothetical protein KAM428_17800 [Pseudomonas alcaligenes]GIZ71299.1 hypothetical protein KAM429_20600 [Pseudomonas alcaligenes]GIZ75464.1 hypothetical protein KAM430_18730 [Pseudomonas alcaligenes]GIZ79527.1 hypothetical protein KAM432_15750 [Pseudomonas alcaligenes]
MTLVDEIARAALPAATIELRLPWNIILALHYNVATRLLFFRQESLGRAIKAAPAALRGSTRQNLKRQARNLATVRNSRPLWQR